MSPGRMVVAMSGGVDSSVAASLLAEAGHEVVGVFMRNGVPAHAGASRRQGCCGVEDAHDARRVADRLGIAFYALDFADAFEGLIEEFVDSYASGRTPNPCIECNKRFKMGALMKLADQLGAEGVATGHYARIVQREGRFAVGEGHDPDKDQSYVLHSLPQEALARTHLPLGEMAKSRVRELAAERDLLVADKPDSVEICFVPTNDYRDVLRERRPEVFQEGAILDEEGRELGRHEGTVNFTVGQRRGLPGGQPDPIFVAGVEPETGTVRVARREGAQRTRFGLEELTWQSLAPAAPGTSIAGRIRVRHRHRPVPGRLLVGPEGRAEVLLEQPELGIAPGQSAVLYDAEGVILLGGIIAREAGLSV